MTAIHGRARRMSRLLAAAFVLHLVFAWTPFVLAQEGPLPPPVVEGGAIRARPLPGPSQVQTGPARSRLYRDSGSGVSATELIGRALSSNAELAAVRLDVTRARARMRQAGLRPNPSIDFEHTTQRGSPGERETAIGVAVPLEVGGQRGRRIDLAEAELEAAQAELADRERRLRIDVLTNYSEALAALRELETLEQLNVLDVRTAHIVEARVTEGEAAPLELNLLRTEVDRLRSRAVLAEGRLEASLLRLKSLTGIPVGAPLRVREDLALAGPPVRVPPSRQDAVEIALGTRPDLRLARLHEAVARAGLRLARAQAAPEVTAFARYSTTRSVFNETPVGLIQDRDKLVTFGVSIGLPVFNRNQGLAAEAEAAIEQAGRRREYVEQLVRAEVESAYARYEAAEAALTLFEQGVLVRSNQNIGAIREAYQLGVFPVTDLLAEQRRLVDSQREYTEALAERYRALADLHAALGVPPVESAPRTPAAPTTIGIPTAGSPVDDARDPGVPVAIDPDDDRAARPRKPYPGLGTSLPNPK